MFVSPADSPLAPHSDCSVSIVQHCLVTLTLPRCLTKLILMVRDWSGSQDNRILTLNQYTSRHHFTQGNLSPFARYKQSNVLNAVRRGLMTNDEFPNKTWITEIQRLQKVLVCGVPREAGGGLTVYWVWPDRSVGQDSVVWSHQQGKHLTSLLTTQSHQHQISFTDFSLYNFFHRNFAIRYINAIFFHHKIGLNFVW